MPRPRWLAVTLWECELCGHGYATPQLAELCEQQHQGADPAAARSLTGCKGRH